MAIQSEYNEQAQKKLKEIISLCYEISTKTKADAFVDYSPHTGQIDVKVYENGWKPDCTTYVNIPFVYFGKHKELAIGYDEYEDYGLEPLDKVIYDLTKLYQQLSEDKPNES